MEPKEESEYFKQYLKDALTKERLEGGAWQMYACNIFRIIGALCLN